MTHVLPNTTPAFPNSAVVTHDGFSFELVPDSAWRFRESLESLRGDVIEIAARSRGWQDEKDLAHFRDVFKLESLFAANCLALIRRECRLVGLVSVTYDVPADDGLILHVGSLGLLPEAQNRGFLPTLFSLLWETVRQDPEMRECIDTGRAFLTAITQSPFIISFLSSVSDLYPMPGLSAPPAGFLPVAERIVQRFDPHVAFDPQTFLLRNECEFFYRKIPYSADKRVNEFCDHALRYAEGDTFVVVGRVRAAAVSGFVEMLKRSHGELLERLLEGVTSLGPTLADRRGGTR